MMRKALGINDCRTSATVTVVICVVIPALSTTKHEEAVQQTYHAELRKPKTSKTRRNTQIKSSFAANFF